MNKYIKIWRKYGAVIILTAQILTMILRWDVVNAFVIALWLTVPCGIKEVNKHWYLWYPRQLLFLSLTVLSFIKVF